MAAYYNEFDPFAAEWLRNLIRLGQIPPGDVDERSIKEVHPDDVKGYVQCHWFAGIGGWSLAARLAGWPDDRELWTGSAPCQPFSNAGEGRGTDDPRHLWPDFFRLIRARRPALVMGEQVASALGRAWFDGVASDLEGEDYACRAADIPACAVDAPHIRSRLYWIAERGGVGLADASGSRRDAAALSGVRGEAQSQRPRDGELERSHGLHGVGLADAGRLAGRPGPGQPGNGAERADLHGSGAAAYPDRGGRAGWPEGAQREPERRTAAERADDVEHAPRLGRGEGRPEHEFRSGRGASADADAFHVALPGGDRRAEAVGTGSYDPGAPECSTASAQPAGGSRHSFWSDHEWLVCHDGKARRTLAGLPLLVDGVSGRVALGDALPGRVSEDEAHHLISRVGAWRGFGNAIVPQLAAEVIGAYLDTEIVGDTDE